MQFLMTQLLREQASHPTVISPSTLLLFFVPRTAYQNNQSPNAFYVYYDIAIIK
jgi:hypothetical protein